ncbi:hypothetical protein M9H77_02825 [Catharanthus roseus]|uniref:Uncharacterized protein n=1 Tax=Catharanthus roseus TaxID=4058 RepID=A0ACC0C9S3_CATRO|nr:hypothetical protein M9H77_02825 [Catharanthus roseus]
MQKMKDKLKKQESRLEDLTTKVIQLINASPHGVRSSEASRVCISATSHDPSTSTQPRPSSRPLTVRTSAMLKGFNDPTENVTKGYLVSMDLGKQVAGLPLGTNYYESAMDDCGSQLPPNSQDPSAPNDSVAQGKVPSKKLPYQVFQEQQTMLEKLAERYQEQEEQFRKQEQRMENILSMMQNRNQNDSPMNTRMSSSSSIQVPQPRSSLNLMVKSQVILKSVIDQNTIGAKGLLALMDPIKEVDKYRLGIN